MLEIFINSTYCLLSGFEAALLRKLFPEGFHVLVFGCTNEVVKLAIVIEVAIESIGKFGLFSAHPAGEDVSRKVLGGVDEKGSLLGIFLDFFD